MWKKHRRMGYTEEKIKNIRYKMPCMMNLWKNTIAGNETVTK